MKKLNLLFTALLLLCSVGTATAHNFEVDGIYYNITDDTNKTVEVTYKGDYSNSYSNEYTGSVVIPESVTYNGTTYSVTSIGNAAFIDCTGLTSITIPNSVTSIGSYAFNSCTGLRNVVIGNSVTSIGNNAFNSCTGLTSITIPNSVTSIGLYAFWYCDGLTSIEFNAENCTSMGNYYYPPFRNCTALSTVTIGENVKNIPPYAFYGCTGLTSITIPNSVTSIGYEAFSGCSGLTSVVIGNSVTSIGKLAFEGCSGLTSISIPNSVTSIGNAAFIDCTGLKSVTIPNSVTGIGESAFFHLSGLTSITIPNSVTSIGKEAFYYCTALTSITIANGNAKYDSRDNCNAIIETATNTLIAGCKNTLIPNSVISIGDYAFYYCTGLTSITIPNSVTSIGNYAFYYCTGLTEIFSNILAEDLFIPGSSAFAGVDKTNCTLYVPYGAKETYATMASWNEFANIVEMDPPGYKLTVSAAGYATLYLDYATVIPEGVEVYTTKEVDGNLLKMELVEEDVLPANTAVIVKAAEGSYTFVQTDEVISEIADNLLNGSVEDEYINVPSNQKAFVLSRVDGEVGMYLAQLTDGRFLNNANKAYLLLDDNKLGLYDEEVDTSVGGAQLSLRFDFRNTTAIGGIENNDANSTLYYDLSGRRVENPTRGIYIVNGKKVLVK